MQSPPAASSSVSSESKGQTLEAPSGAEDRASVPKHTEEDSELEQWDKRWQQRSKEKQ